MFRDAYELTELVHEKWGLFPAGLLLVLLFFVEGGRQYRRQRFWTRLSPVGRLVYVGSVLGLSFAIVFGIRVWKQWKYEKAPLPYATAEAALADGCMVVQASGTLMDGKENFGRFLDACTTARSASLTIAVHDGGTIVRVDTLAYDGIVYWYTADAGYLHQEPVVRMYLYLINDVHAPQNNDWYTYREVWMLTDTEDLAYEDTLGSTDAEASAHIVFMETDWLELLPP